MLRKVSCLVVVGCWLIGCAHSSNSNEGQVQSYTIPTVEAGWIRDGEPIEYGGQRWYAVDDVEVLQDSEMYQVGDYKGVQVFVDKIDAKPYKRLYTKFSKNKFRYFELIDHD